MDTLSMYAAPGSPPGAPLQPAQKHPFERPEQMQSAAVGPLERTAALMAEFDKPIVVELPEEAPPVQFAEEQLAEHRREDEPVGEDGWPADPRPDELAWHTEYPTEPERVAEHWEAAAETPRVADDWKAALPVADAAPVDARWEPVHLEETPEAPVAVATEEPVPVEEEPHTLPERYEPSIEAISHEAQAAGPEPLAVAEWFAQQAGTADGWVQENIPLEQLEFAERRVIVRLSTGETLDVGSAASATEAVEAAREIVRYIGEAEGSGDWPELSGRFIRPDTIVSVDVQIAG